MLKFSFINSKMNKQEQLQEVSKSLQYINQYIPEDKQIKQSLCLYSKFSPKSIDLIKHIPVEMKRFFYFLNIDNALIRKKILNSTTVKIKEVPCVIIVDIKGEVSIYEGIKSVEIIQTFKEILINGERLKQQQSQLGLNEPEEITSLDEIIDDMEDENEYPAESKRPPKKSPIPLKMPAPPQPRNEYNPQQSNPPQRKKVKHALRQTDLNFPTDQYKPDVGISSIRHNPPKGVGHNKLAYSSLKDLPQYEEDESEEDDDMNITGGELLEDDLDDILNEDQTMDPQITKNSKNSKNNVDKKEAMDSVKKAAMEMQRSRENE